MQLKQFNDQGRHLDKIQFHKHALNVPLASLEVQRHRPLQHIQSPSPQVYIHPVDLTAEGNVYKYSLDLV